MVVHDEDGRVVVLDDFVHRVLHLVESIHVIAMHGKEINSDLKQVLRLLLLLVALIVDCLRKVSHPGTEARVIDLDQGVDRRVVLDYVLHIHRSPIPEHLEVIIVIADIVVVLENHYIAVVDRDLRSCKTGSELRVLEGEVRHVVSVREFLVIDSCQVIDCGQLKLFVVKEVEQPKLAVFVIVVEGIITNDVVLFV